MKKIYTLLGVLCSSIAALTLQAQTPTYKTYSFDDDNAILQRISDNGEWAAFCGANSENALYNDGARIINLTTDEVYLLSDALNADTLVSIGVFDVSNDGEISVGEVNSKPAYYTFSTGEWTFLSTGDEADCGQVNCVTPDGLYAAGILNYSDSSLLFEELGAVWDLTTGEIISTPGIPALDMAHEDKGQNRFIQISADGNTVLGCMSFSYLPSGSYAGGLCYYVYDIAAETYKMIGFEESDTEDWTPLYENLLIIGDAYLSNDGKWVTGAAYIHEDTEDSDYGTEYKVPFKFNVETEEFTVYDDEESYDLSGWSIDNDGEAYAAGPVDNPYRYFAVRSGNYWVAFDETLDQYYDFDIASLLGIENTGTPMSVTDDALTIGCIIGDGMSYIITLPDKFADIAAYTNLLSSYTASPASGSSFSKLTTVSITFTRSVQVVGDASDIELMLVAGSETVCTASACVVSSDDTNTINITFRNGTLEKTGQPYRVIIPEQMVCIEGDTKRYNEEIKLTYIAREDGPVELQSSSPKDGASIGKLDMSTSPLILTFDADLSLYDEDLTAELYQTEVEDAFASLLMAVSGAKLYVYPSTTQYLYSGVDYKVVVPAGVVTDVTGNSSSANEEIVINLSGTYEAEISYESNILFEEDFSSGVANMLLFDGDENEPDEESAGYGFEVGSEYAWIPVRDDTSSSDWAAASTSQYTPAGKADDWMVIPQLNVVDQLCKLTFKSQSLRNASVDSLKVYVWESNNIYSGLSASVVELIRTEGTLVFSELQLPGSSEDEMAGDWVENSISLADFAGKNVYIAFLNDNEDGSIVMVDDIEVLHELPFYAGFSNADIVVAQTEITIEGEVSIQDDEETFTTATLILSDGEGQTVSEINETGLSLVAGDTYPFSFENPLPLTIGEENDYTVYFKFNDTENTVNKTVKDLSFQPTKRIVLEEFTGEGCSNCPLGILAIENIEKYYGDLFIPLALHAYTGDRFAAGSSSYASFLEFSAAPTGRVQRGEITSPMVEEDGDYSFMPFDDESTTWLNEVILELEEAAEAEISATCELTSSETVYSVTCDLEYALAADELNLKLFAVILENDLVGYQTNNLYSQTDEDLGEWGKGGIYGYSSVSPYIFDHVVRGVYGETYTGTPELFPTEVVAGETYTTSLSIPVNSLVSDVNNTEIVLMLFDGNTDELLNACKVAPGESTGISIPTTDQVISFDLSARNGEIVLETPTETTFRAYTTGGLLMGTERGTGSLSIPTNGYTGVVIIRLETPNGVETRKIITK